tara:strand:- start:2614 stop:2889 length:276 start_codon:yes stop_codon:yes gene_type:complete
VSNIFNKEVEDLVEGYGMFKQTIRQRFPKNLSLSEEFISAFKEEFLRQAKPLMEEDADGNQVEIKSKRKPEAVLKDFQKALQFLVPVEKLN